MKAKVDFVVAAEVGTAVLEIVVVDMVSPGAVVLAAAAVADYTSVVEVVAVE